jgi:hypothetical protein
MGLRGARWLYRSARRSIGFTGGWWSCSGLCQRFGHHRHNISAHYAWYALGDQYWPKIRRTIRVKVIRIGCSCNQCPYRRVHSTHIVCSCIHHGIQVGCQVGGKSSNVQFSQIQIGWKCVLSSIHFLVDHCLEHRPDLRWIVVRFGMTSFIFRVHIHSCDHLEAHPLLRTTKCLGCPSNTVSWPQTPLAEYGT